MLHRRLLVYANCQESNATWQIRLGGPLSQCGFELVPAHQVLSCPKDAVPALAQSFDAFLVHRGINRRCPIYPVLLAAARQQRIPVIHDTDDLLLNVHREHPDHALYRARVGYALKALLDADVVVVSTPPLAEQLAALPSPVVVIPNELPTTLWRDVCEHNLQVDRNGSGDQLTVGYIGTATHQSDLLVIEDVLLDLLSRHQGRVRFLSVGVPLNPRWKRHPWVSSIMPPNQVSHSYAEFARFAAALPIDVGIAPLRDTTFNCCKSDVKFQEYAALGVVGVYSDLPAYRSSVRHGENGFLASQTAQWRACLEELVTSPELRRRMARTAGEGLLARWRAARAAALWEDVVEQTHQRVRSASRTEPPLLALAVEQMLEHHADLERQLRRTVEYHLRKEFWRLLRKLGVCRH